ncbi:tetratricopeptide repeat protein [Ferruginibacter sp. SUN002]|uniref:tetratricopeptide repeat protein n=1 Tax=Ferruginibacter sp. SUN002 TaxID=2937789 RepID=UPI003D360C2E
MNFRKLLFVAIVLICNTALAQQTTSTKKATTAKVNQHLKVFNQTMGCGDFSTAISALNYYIAEEGSTNPYVDTLAILYLQQGAYPQCYYWVEQRLATNPEDNTLLEMKAVCLDKSGETKEAISIFEKLFKKTQNVFHAYKLLDLQYSIKRLSEAVATAEAAEKLQYKPEYTMTYTVGQQMGRTYLQSAVLNIHGLALYDLGKKDEAKKCFEQALALDTTFALAKQNLEAIRSIENATNSKVIPGVQAPNAPAAIKQN